MGASNACATTSSPAFFKRKGLETRPPFVRKSYEAYQENEGNRNSAKGETIMEKPQPTLAFQLTINSKGKFLARTQFFTQNLL